MEWIMKPTDFCEGASKTIQRERETHTDRERWVLQQIFSIIKNTSSVQQSRDTANSFKIIIKSTYRWLTEMSPDLKGREKLCFCSRFERSSI
jgi:hypothetical protein